MAKCWTCGTPVSGWNYTCSSCKSLSELKSLQNDIDSYSEDIQERIDSIEQSLLYRFRELEGTISEGLSEIASAIEWGFGELSWQLQQQTDVLKNIDQTLKTPSETKANEWRHHAEELRRRGVLDGSEEFFLKALNEYRLDYRIYVGLAETYLRMNKFDKAKALLEKSLPHAPKEIQGSNIEHRRLLDLTRDFLYEGRINKTEAIESRHSKTGEGLAEAQEIIDQIANQGAKAELGLAFDWKSHSYRLIGHIYACEEDYDQAIASLRSAMELSPGYVEAHYDLAQYCAQMGDKRVGEKVFSKADIEYKGTDFLERTKYALVDVVTALNQCIDSLAMAILLKPVYWYLAQKERNFDPLRKEVEKLLLNIASEASERASDAIVKSEGELKETYEAVSKAKEALRISRDKSKLNSSTMIEDAETKLQLAKDKVASRDYTACLEAKEIAVESSTIAKEALDTAHKEHRHFQERRAVRVKSAWEAILLSPLAFGFIGAIGGCAIGVFSARTVAESAKGGLLLGAVCGLILGSCGAYMELK